MATAINNSFSAIVPAVYGTATPVIDVGHGAGAINAAAALTDTGSVVVNLGSAPSGAVTYTASGLAHEMSAGGIAETAATRTTAQAKSASTPATVPDPAIPRMPGQSAATGTGAVYDASGAFTSGVAVQIVHGSAGAPSAATGTLVSTQA